MKHYAIILSLLAIVVVTLADEEKKDCIMICDRMYMPVCAIDANNKMQTFGNMCMYEGYACEHPERKMRIIDEDDACPQ